MCFITHKRSTNKIKNIIKMIYCQGQGNVGIFEGGNISNCRPKTGDSPYW